MRASVRACVYVCGRARAGIIIYPDPVLSFAGLPGFDIWPVYRSGQISPVFVFVFLCVFLVLTFLPG